MTRYRITVTFPADWPDEPALAGTTQHFYYDTEADATLTLRGFQLRGAIC